MQSSGTSSNQEVKSTGCMVYVLSGQRKCKKDDAVEIGRAEAMSRLVFLRNFLNFTRESRILFYNQVFHN